MDAGGPMNQKGNGGSLSEKEKKGLEQVQYCRTLPVFDEVDILVVGAGPAGIGPGSKCGALPGLKQCFLIKMVMWEDRRLPGRERTIL